MRNIDQMNNSLPGLPLPPPLTAQEPGTWAQSTVTVRLGEIAARALVENEFPSLVEKRYRDLIEDLPHGTIRPLEEPLAPDQAEWQSYVLPYLGMTWLEVPWFFAETYYYRRVLEATGFFQPGPMAGIDPFRVQKRLGLAASRTNLVRLLGRTTQWATEREPMGGLHGLVLANLWGNRADLSLWPAAAEGEAAEVDQADSYLLVDDRQRVQAVLGSGIGAANRVDLVVDNAGFEFLGDLVMGDYLLANGLAGRVHYHLKRHPTFVSDATLADYRDTLRFLEESQVATLQQLAARLSAAQEQGRLAVHHHPFWTSPLPAWQMPPDLRESLATATLVFIKGDANYRRLLGDLHWPYDSPFSQIVSYFPAPLCALRTLKAEVAAGLAADQIHRLDKEDPTWMTNGRWGVIQVSTR